jgi:hypothetical protein
VASAESLAWQLEAAGCRVLIQAWDFGAGTDFVTEMRRATARAEWTLAVRSPAYVASGFAIPLRDLSPTTPTLAPSVSRCPQAVRLPDIGQAGG